MSVKGPMPYLPFLDVPGGAFRWRLGVHPLDPADWIELGPDADAAIAEKERLCRSDLSAVFAAMPGIEAEATEVATALVGHLRRRWPERYGDVGLRSDLHPLDAAARLVPEDLVVMVEREGRLVFGGGSVCFPNRWDLHSKVGRTLTEVHAPVPRLNEQLERPIERFLEHLGPARGYWRLGWGIIDVDELHTPPGRREPGVVAPIDRFLRVERETLRRFPETNCVLFTIRTYLRPLADLSEPDRPAARALADQVASMTGDVRAYKDLGEIGDELVKTLRS